MGRLVINGEEIYELDEQCLKEKNEKRMRQEKLFAGAHRGAGRYAPERGNGLRQNDIHLNRR